MATLSLQPGPDGGRDLIVKAIARLASSSLEDEQARLQQVQIARPIPAFYWSLEEAAAERLPGGEQPDAWYYLVFDQQGDPIALVELAELDSERGRQLDFVSTRRAAAATTVNEAVLAADVQAKSPAMRDDLSLPVAMIRAPDLHIHALCVGDAVDAASAFFVPMEPAYEPLAPHQICGGIAFLEIASARAKRVLEGLNEVVEPGDHPIAARRHREPPPSRHRTPNGQVRRNVTRIFESARERHLAQVNADWDKAWRHFDARWEHWFEPAEETTGGRRAEAELLKAMGYASRERAAVLNLEMAAVHRFMQTELSGNRDLAASLGGAAFALGRELAPDHPPTITIPHPRFRPGDLITNSLDMKLAFIPAGTFMMGSPEDEDGRDYDETQHEVTLTAPFFMGVTPVTQGQYEQVMGVNPSFFTKGADRPVETVSWNMAVAFCEKLSGLPAEREAGRVYRLPTEAQWEYACRAGTTTRFWSGDKEQDLARVGWYLRNSEHATHPVGEKPANPWGLHDVHGNVWEWCQDWYGPYATGPAIDPVGPEQGSSRVLRGGSWGNLAHYCRCARPYRMDPTDRYIRVGFRLALDFSS